jgi:hypothetical protein
MDGRLGKLRGMPCNSTIGVAGNLYGIGATRPYKSCASL